MVSEKIRGIRKKVAETKARRGSKKLQRKRKRKEQREKIEDKLEPVTSRIEAGREEIDETRKELSELSEELGVAGALEGSGGSNQDDSPIFGGTGDPLAGQMDFDVPDFDAGTEGDDDIEDIGEIDTGLDDIL